MIPYVIIAPATPGAKPSVCGEADTIAEARTKARALWRADLHGQDVRIERPEGTLVEYAGPAR